jgi:Class III signal peptide.
MSFLKDESGQGAAEYILLFGGVIVVAIIALYVYYTYIQNITPVNINDDINNIRDSANSPTPVDE